MSSLSLPSPPSHHSHNAGGIQVSVLRVTVCLHGGILAFVKEGYMWGTLDFPPF